MIGKIKFLLLASIFVLGCEPERRNNTTTHGTNIRDAALDPDFEGFENEPEAIEEVEETEEKQCPHESVAPGSSPGSAMFRTPMRDADGNVHDIMNFCDDPEMRVTMLISSTMW